MRCDDCGTTLYQAGEVVPAGRYMRVDDGSFRELALPRPGPLPASFDGHIAEYRDVTRIAASNRRHGAATSDADARDAARSAEEHRSKL